MDAIVKTDFCFPGQKSVYKGKVRDVYDINDEYLVMVVSATIRTLCTSTATASFHIRNSFSFFCNKFL